MRDEELLQIVRGERARSIGFDIDPVLLADREKALFYYKGEMPDVPYLPNRSKAVSTDVADTIETIMPDLVEIFTGGDDVASFIPSNQADVEGAQQETEYLHHVIFGTNAGFMTLYTFLKDALLVKTGVVKWWWENKPEPKLETFEEKTAAEVGMAMQDGELGDLKFDGVPYEIGDDLPPGAEDAPLFSFTMKSEGPDGQAKIHAIPPEDFTVSRDCVTLADTTYCAFRSRPRAQKLKEDGHDPAIVDRLPPYGLARNEQVQLARDTAGEHYFPIGSDGPNRDMRAVEVVEHFVRIYDDKEKRIKIWRVFTGGNESILIDKEEVDQIPFAAITPFVVTHRFYGESIADKVMEIQRIKTALMRGQLDYIYFSLNQRHYVDMQAADTFTISDLLDNRPGVPVRGNGPNAVTALQTGGQPAPYLEALEYFSTVAESRTGVVRNSQGLNPDTLHDTAAGAMALMNMAQRRVRMIARIFAETGVKDMFLGVHALIRKHASQKQITRLSGKFVEVDPTQWAERTDMTIEIGVGAGGAQQKFASLTKVIELQGEIAKELPCSGLVTPENAYRAIVDASKASGLKSPEQYFTDPATTPPKPPAPNPDMLKVQAQSQADQAKLQQNGQVEQMKDAREKMALQAAHERESAKLQATQQIDQGRLSLDALKLQQEKELALAKLQQERELAIMEMRAKYGIAAMNAATQLQVQASESSDAQAMADADRHHDMTKTALDHARSLHEDVMADKKVAEQKSAPQ